MNTSSPHRQQPHIADERQAIMLLDHVRRSLRRLRRLSRQARPRRYASGQFVPQGAAPPAAAPQAPRRKRFPLDVGTNPKAGEHLGRMGVPGSPRDERAAGAPPVAQLLLRQSQEQSHTIAGQLAAAIVRGDLNALPPWIDALADAGYPEEVIEAALTMADNAAAGAALSAGWASHQRVNSPAARATRGGRLRAWMENYA